MRLLLDSHVLLWWLEKSDRLPTAIMNTISDGANEAHVSAASVWELSIKQSIGKLGLPGDLHAQTRTEGFTELPVTGEHAAALRDLPLHHRDPFDRVLVAQARIEGLTLVTSDRAMSAYDVPILRAAG